MRYELIKEKSVGEFNIKTEMRQDYKLQAHIIIANDYRELACRTWHLYDHDSSLRSIVILKEQSRYKIYGDGYSLETVLLIKPAGAEAASLANKMAEIVYKSSPVSTHISSEYQFTSFELGISLVSNDYLFTLFNVLKKNELFLFPDELIKEIKQLKYDRIYSEKDRAYYDKINTYIAKEKFKTALNYAIKTFKTVETAERFEAYHCDYLYYLGSKLSEIPGADKYAFMAFNAIDDSNDYYFLSQEKAFLIARYYVGDSTLSKIEKDYWLKTIMILALGIGKKEELRVIERLLANFCGNAAMVQEMFDSEKACMDGQDSFNKDKWEFSGTSIIFGLAKVCQQQNAIIKKLTDELAVIKNHEPLKMVAIDKADDTSKIVSMQQNICMFSRMSSSLNESLKCQSQDLLWIKKMSDHSAVDYMSQDSKSYAIVPYKPPKLSLRMFM